MPRTHTDIRSFPTSGYVEGVYSIVNPQVGTTRAGKAYLKCILRDATGEVVARQWSFDEAALEELAQSGFVWAAGHTQVYNGQIQLIVEQVRPVQVDEDELTTLLPTTAGDIEQMYAEVVRILGSLEHPAIRALAETYLADEPLMADFKRCPAAVVVHHACIGGLLEHTLQLLKAAEAILPLYPALNRDLVLMGLFLHDLGKTAELTWTRGFDYTTDGNLIGHVVRGVIWLQVKAALAAKSGHRLPADALRVLQHIILSHHGEIAHGAVRVPSTPEAIFVALLDNLDAKTAIGLAHARAGASGNGEFTDRIWSLDTRLYRPDPLAE